MLRAARQRRCWTLKSAAARIGCHYTYLWHLENSDRAPSVAMATDIIKGLELNREQAIALLSESVDGAGRSRYGSPKAAA